MKKIMFNDRYGLTEAVLEKRKTMTRRMVHIGIYNQTDWKAVGEGNYEAVSDGEGDWHDIRLCGQYQIGEEVAVAQSYRSIVEQDPDNDYGNYYVKQFRYTPGWTNKMFVRADLMPHRIRITNIRVERLQDISDEDCLREGLFEVFPYIDRNPNDKVKSYRFRDKKSKFGCYQLSPVRDCFAVLIDRVNGKGTWERNPWVFVYEFELVQ